ncbi:Nutrient and stress factor 1 [Choanephora cucurbitarum]|uniref:Nutrient and stress factor 1 n=1 Tax=Choanephora cucurbitarum TaxID=101091 RepID=A0A1C7NJW3_9FUNG|nr:Nutrient and stress factor 1 [Choanephora cucurbitarum]
MPNKRRTSGSRSAPKLFKCTGYGDCDMVFTRSEHLARHERKHTGEKPYKCIVPGCDRMFSRFDNMMQHTQTHEKNKKTLTTPMTNSNKRTHKSDNLIKKEPFKFKPNSNIAPLEGFSMINSRTLPLPTRRASIAAPYHTGPYHTSSTVPYYHSLSVPQSQYDPSHRSSWPLKRDLYPHQTYPPPHPYSRVMHEQEYYPRRRSSASTFSIDSPIISPISSTFPQTNEPQVRRRISVDELHLPIENLRDSPIDSKIHLKPIYSHNISKKNEIDITSDEYEALEGFSKFRSGTIESEVIDRTPSPKIGNASPNLASEVCAMRQRVMSLNESYQRG